MSQTVITYAFEQWKAQQAVNGDPLLLDGFIFANVPGLDPAAPIDRAEGIPSDGQIVHRQDVSHAGVVNENAVVYSVTLGADVGDFEFNWIGLVNKDSNLLAMVVHAPTQKKVKNAAGQQGNVLTRSFLMEYNGAETQTQITTPAETWQIDFTARLAGMDERQRLENLDIYGPAAFFGDGYLVAKTGSDYSITAGAGYVGGLRTQLARAEKITVTTKPVKVWVDVCWKGALTSIWEVETVLHVAASMEDYVKDGRQHYVFAVAQINADGSVTDLRPQGSLSEQAGAAAFLRKDDNLAALKDKRASRRNLELGDAAVWGVGTQSGNLLPIGGLGISPALPAKTGVDLNTLMEFGFHVVQGATNAPLNENDKTVWFVSVRAWDSQTAGDKFRVVQVADGYGTSGSLKNRSFRRTYAGSAAGWSAWVEFYSEANKPKSGDVGAVSITGDTMTGDLYLPRVKASVGFYITEDIFMYKGAGNLCVNFKGKEIILGSNGQIKSSSLKVDTDVLVGSSRQYMDGNDLYHKVGNSYFSMKASGALSVPTTVEAGTSVSVGSAYFQGDGNIWGTRWNANGGWLWDSIVNELNKRATIDYVNSLRDTAGNGWFRSGSSGRIIQAFNVSDTGGQVVRRVNFPIPFPNGVDAVSASWTWAAGQMDFPVRIVSWDKSGVSYVADGGANVSFFVSGS